MPEALDIVLWPDPRLKKVSVPVIVFDEALRSLVDEMFRLMREHKGVGLAAPQVGRNIRLFVMNHTGAHEDDRIYVNPELTDAEGDEEDEEGCLSLPSIRANIARSKKVKMRAQDLAGNWFEQVEAGYVPRVWQHEFDHLNGTLITDRMGYVAKVAAKRTLRELEEKYNAARPKKKG